MFTALEALARRTPLLITISGEGDALRVSITPTPLDSKAKPTIQPVSLVATAAELDEGLAEALLTWQNPKRSLQDQVLAASEQAAPATLPAPATTTPRAKPGPKPKTKTSADTAAPGPADAGTTSTPASADTAAPGPADASATSAPASADTAAPGTADASTTSAPASADAAAPGPADASATSAPASADTAAPDDAATTTAVGSKAGDFKTINEPPEGATRGPAADTFTLDIF